MTRAAERWVWQDSWQNVNVRFLGRGRLGRGRLGRVTGETAETSKSLRWLHNELPDGVELSTLQQIHSARVLAARAGCVGEGDALESEQRSLALAVVTADCVPVLLASPRRLAAVHAGWRGIEQRILAATLARFADRPIRAWIGPAIGSCCYEVGEDVAKRVADVSTPSVIVRSPGRRPHLDLVAATRWQLEALGLSTIVTLPQCTRCETEDLWSYRREGDAAGRNVAVIWRS